jgi:hypothetical protein
VSAGPVWTIEEAAAEFGGEPGTAPAPALGEHTDAWRADFGL